MVDYWTDDYTRSRAVGTVPYSIEDKIGRQDWVDKIAVSSVTASGVIELLPASPLGRRNYIKILNNGPNTVEIHSSTASGSVGYPVASGVEWEEYSDAVFYMKSAGTSVLTVYERSSKGNFDA